MLLGHWQVTGPSVHEEFQPFGQNEIMTDTNFHGKFYQAEESITYV